MNSTKTKIIVWTLLSLMPVIGMCIDLVSPSLPAISSYFHIAEYVSKNVISIYLVGFAFGNFLAGFLIDAYGRQKIIRISLFGFIISSMLPLVFPSISWLLTARVLQGLTIGAVSVTLRSICADVLTSEELTKLGPWFGTMWGIGPIIGPIIGGYLQVYFGWQGGFYFFTALSFILFLIVLIVVPETHFNRHPLSLRQIQSNCREILSNSIFMGIMMLMGLSYSLLIVFNVAGPFLIQNTLHHSPIFFGHIAFWLGIIFVSATFVGRLLIQKFRIETIWITGIHTSLLTAVLAWIISMHYPENITAIFMIAACMFITCGIVFPLSLGKGLSLFRHIAGTATAIMYLVNILITSVVAYVSGFVQVTTATKLTILYIFLMVAITILYWKLLRTSKNNISEEKLK